MIEITEDELKNRLDSKLNVLRGQSTGNGSVTLNNNPNLIEHPIGNNKEGRDLVTALAITNGISNTAKLFGLDRHQVSNISRGLNGDRIPDPVRKKEVLTVREKVAEFALEKLMTGLGLMTDERLASVPIQELSTINKDMSILVKNISGDQGEKRNIAQVVLFAPKMREEDRYEAITIEAQVS